MTRILELKQLFKRSPESNDNHVPQDISSAIQEKFQLHQNDLLLFNPETIAQSFHKLKHLRWSASIGPELWPLFWRGQRFQPDLLTLWQIQTNRKLTRKDVIADWNKHLSDPELICPPRLFIVPRNYTHQKIPLVTQFAIVHFAFIRDRNRFKFDHDPQINILPISKQEEHFQADFSNQINNYIASKYGYFGLTKKFHLVSEAQSWNRFVEALTSNPSR